MNRDLILIGLSLWVWGVGEGMFSIFLTLNLQGWGATPVEIGGIIGFVAIAMAVMQVPSGYMSDRIGPRRVIQLSWVMGLASAVIMALASSLTTFVVGMIVFYMSSFAMPGLNKYNTTVRGKLSVERALTITSVFYNFGAILGPLLGGYLGKIYGLQRNFFYASGFFLVSTIIIFFIRDHQASTTVIEQDHQPSETVLKNKKYLIFLGIIFLTMFATYLPQPLTPNFLQNERQVSIDQIGQLGSLSSLGIALIMLFMGGMNSQAGLVLGQMLVGLYALLLWQGSGMIWYGAAYFVLGGYRLMRAMVVARARSLVRVAQAGLAFGLLETVNSVAVILAPTMAGLLYDQHPSRVYIVTILLISLSLAINLLFLPATQQTTVYVAVELVPTPDGELNEPGN